MIALSPNTHEVDIYATNGVEDNAKWVKKYTLSEHTGTISGIDWSPESDQIVTSAHDRNAYVWKYEQKEDAWKPSLVILRINRAAYEVKWSPNGKKFAVASGAKCVPVCNYEADNDWWVSKMIKKHKSTVLALAWSPDNKLLCTGSTDNKCRIFSGYIKDVDADNDTDLYGSVFDKQKRFGEMLAEFDVTKSWVQNVAWSPDGYRIAFAGHNSSIHFAQLGKDVQPSIQSVTVSGLPFQSVSFVDNDNLVGVGWECNPMLFKASGGNWSFSKSLDQGQAKPKMAVQKSGFAAARGMFAASTDKGQDASQGEEDTVLATLHQNTIIHVTLYKPGVVSTSSIDGTVRFWKI